ncbi:MULTISPECIES: propionate catabolism operon regulatory protein PrpR [Paraburkholderia]|uniref:propionate catabolism operon regulatory protein PrpR n=1 Tax=Paraburkholderia TaxID=1822464 RepID=UPI00224FD3D3|nr:MULTISPECIES: propionate catabolism operon regulatory protein PrpR [Paraburkholderia]MCX4153969.1 propionate catabolism operon regulatory protein PrpR [Paraburkholderia aspalathi]MDN7163384.1 propionate catabolism operon regulatory protein PrpR [Paraburkholderia sp. SECH2]MDQ6391869.1 propionate catabolism operon regulatory protein PrpR [Paraburkholderia aspalathi]
MSTPPFDPAQRPRIWAVSISRLRDLFFDIAGEYVERADLRIVAHGFEDAVHEIDAVGAGRPDVVIAGGSNGAYLKTRVSVPVVLIGPTGFDVMHALARARRDGAKVALVTHGNTPDEVRRFIAAYGIDVTFASYQSAQDAESVVLDLRDRGIQAVVGPGLIADLAANAGMGAVFLYSRASVRAAFDTALEVAQATRRETVRRQRLDNLLQHLRDGVVALDAQGRVEAMNQRLASVLGIDAAQAVGRALLDLAPDLAGSLPDADGDTFCTVRGASYVVHRGPLASSSSAAGTVLTFQESRAVERLDRTLRSRQRVQQFSARYQLGDIVGVSDSIERVRTLVQRYAKSDATVLILGESGTGKEMVAQSMHQLSARRDFAFVAINCGAFPEALLESELFGYEEGAFTGARKGGKAGLIEVAHRGTLFLDEIAEMPLSLQSRLLRVLQEREVVRLGSTEPTRVDIRVVAATHRALTEGIEVGSFRADLYYRLNILSIALPPLRERPNDLLPLAVELLLQAASREPRLAARLPDADAAKRVLASLSEPFKRYTWPGNVRELQNVIERIAVELADADMGTGTDSNSAAETVFTREVLRTVAPEIFDQPHTRTKKAALTLRQRSRHVEADEIRAALAACDGDRDAVCQALGISKTTLWRKLNAAQ